MPTTPRPATSAMLLRSAGRRFSTVAMSGKATTTTNWGRNIIALVKISPAA